MRTKGIRVAAAFLLLAGCVTRTEYVYVDSQGNTHRVDSLDRLEIEIKDLKVDETGEGITGTWSARGAWPASADEARQRAAMLSLVGESGGAHHVRSVSIGGRDAEGLVLRPAAAGGASPVSFTLPHGQGQLMFEGTAQPLGGGGTVHVEPEPGYVAEIERLTGTRPAVGQVVEAMLTPLTLADVKGFKDAGLDTSLGDMMMLRQSAVTPDFVAGLVKAGYVFSPREIVRLRQSGVDVEYTAGLRRAGYRFGPSDIVKLRNSGVGVDYARDVRDAGYELNPDELIRIRLSGLPAGYLKELKAAGYQLSTSDAIRLRMSGVGTEFAAALKRAGYDFAVHDLIKLRQSGVSDEFAAALAAPGRENLGADEIIKLRMSGIDAQTLNKLRR